MHGEEAGPRRRAEEPLVRGDGPGHAGAVGMRLLRRAVRVETLRDDALQIRVRRIDF